MFPDEIYRIIYKYANEYLYDIPKFNTTTKKWNTHPNIYCHVCKQKNIALAHICNSCHYNKCGVCDDTLICFSCAH